MRVRVFLGSSQESVSITNELVGLLEARHLEVKPWTESFRPGGFIAQSFLSVLDAADFFVFVMTSDTLIVDPKDHSQIAGPNQNVLFEVGAAYGRYGVLRTLIIKSPEVQLITDLSGLITIPLTKKPGDSNFKSELATVADQLAAKIETVIATDDSIGGRFRWLSLMRCKPANQKEVVNLLDNEDLDPTHKVRFICKGILWGSHDDFLLFSATSVDEFITFVTKLRWKLDPHLDSVDSRMVFPAKFWQKESALPNHYKVFHMVLVSCRPGQVEGAYRALLKASKSEEQMERFKVQIVCVGILTGEADIFFITAAEQTSDHQSFIERHFTSLLSRAWLIRNTSSLAITEFEFSDPNA